VSAEIATIASESVSYTWKRAAAVGEYWMPKYLCLASCGIAVQLCLLKLLPQLASLLDIPAKELLQLASTGGQNTYAWRVVG